MHFVETLEICKNTMKSSQIENAKKFLQLTNEQLAADEIRFSLMHGIAQQVAENPNTYGMGQPWFMVVTNEGQVCGAAMRTPPHNVLMAHFNGNKQETTDELCKAIFELDPHIPGVNGEKEITDMFNHKWCKKANVGIKHSLGLQVYKLEQVTNLHLSPGRLRPAGTADIELVIDWTMAFHRDIHEETVHDQNPAIFNERIKKRIEAGTIFIWENQQPVSLATVVRPTLNGISIGGVYTPKELRGKGYATSCVSEVCKLMLQQYKFCVLYADLANPTSNAIYKRIGFSGYCQSSQYSFDI
jgi:uncharacterized protein